MVKHSLHEKLPCGFITRKRTERYPAFLHYSSVMFIVFIRGSTDGPPSGSLVSGTETASAESENERMNTLVNKTGCSVITVPSLHRMSGVIPKLASLYINDLNQDYSRQIFGISPEAATHLQGFAWPYNLDQLRRVVREVYLHTDGPYITADSVRTVLDEEQKQYYSPSDNASFDLSGTLDEITRRIVLSVYQEENQNQSRTAARLGISRTTLWSMLK